jgi:hypothetical protein
VFILEGLKVLRFDTLLQVFILKVDSWLASALAEFFALRILLEVIFPGNVGGKGVRWVLEYFMRYYTIWLAPVKKYFVPIWEFGKKKRSCLLLLIRTQNSKPAASETKAAACCVTKIAVLWMRAPLPLPQPADMRLGPASDQAAAEIVPSNIKEVNDHLENQDSRRLA